MHRASRQTDLPQISKRVTVLAGAVALALAPASAAVAGDEPDPYELDNRTWIDVSGTIDSVARDSFMLDYGDGIIRVEMDDGDRDADAYKLLRGDTVTVSGMIDDDFYEMRSIEASSVFVEDIGTTFYASAVDEEDVPAAAIINRTPIAIPDMVVRGHVTEVGPNSFKVDTGPRELAIDISKLGYDPLDDDGYQKIEIGDRVKVTGEMARTLFDGRELVADSVIELAQVRTRGSS